MMCSRFSRFSRYGLHKVETIRNVGISSILVNQTANIHAIKFTKRIQLLSKDKLTRKENTLEVQPVSNPDCPLLLLYTWMLAKEKHIYKFANFYNDLGFDVLMVSISPLELLFPVKGSHIVNDNVLEFLTKNYKSNPLLVHGFSVGGYAFCQLVAKMLDNPSAYKDIQARFVCQIWDSAVDIYGIPEGVSKAVTQNVVLQKSIKKYLHWHMKINYEMATKHYIIASKMMHQNAINVPGLLLFSKNDPVSPPEMSIKASATWKEVYFKCFEESRHVGHYQKYRGDYEAEVLTFLERSRLINMKKDRDVI